MKTIGSALFCLILLYCSSAVASCGGPEKKQIIGWLSKYHFILNLHHVEKIPGPTFKEWIDEGRKIDSIVDRLFVFITTGNRGNHQRKALLALRELCTKKHIPKLLEMMGNKNAVTRGDAAYVLGVFNTRQVVAALGNQLRTDPDNEVRFSITASLGEISGKAVLPHMKYAAKDPFQPVSSYASRYLLHGRP